MDHEERIRRLEIESERVAKLVNDQGAALASALVDLKRVCDAMATLGTGYTKLSDAVSELDNDQKKVRATMHKLEASANANGMGITHLIDINNLQTPLLQRLDRVVMGDGSAVQQLKDYGQRFKNWDKVMLAIATGFAVAFGGYLFGKFSAPANQQPTATTQRSDR